MALVLVRTLDDQAQASLAENPHIQIVSEVAEYDTPPKAIVRRKWAGSISKETGRLLQQEVTHLRDQEWERSF